MVHALSLTLSGVALLGTVARGAALPTGLPTGEAQPIIDGLPGSEDLDRFESLKSEYDAVTSALGGVGQPAEDEAAATGGMQDKRDTLPLRIWSTKGAADAAPTATQPFRKGHPFATGNPWAPPKMGKRDDKALVPTDIPDLDRFESLKSEYDAVTSALGGVGQPAEDEAAATGGMQDKRDTLPLRIWSTKGAADAAPTATQPFRKGHPFATGNPWGPPKMDKRDDKAIVAGDEEDDEDFMIPNTPAAATTTRHQWGPGPQIIDEPEARFTTYAGVD